MADSTDPIALPTSPPGVILPPAAPVRAQGPPATTIVMPVKRKIKGYGWKKDHIDHRDKIAARGPAVALPADYSLQPSQPPIYDQGDLGSCTANGIARAIDYERMLQGFPFMFPSRLMIYYNERVMEGDPNDDSGAEIRDGIKSVAAQGVCPESEWPYDVAKFAVQPPAPCYSDATRFKALGYSSVMQNAYYTRYCLAILKRPIVFGFSVFDAFESDAVAATGIVPMPGPSDTPIGGHCVCAVGYDDKEQMFLCANSWGVDWGLTGYFKLPYAYLFSPGLASDLWVIEAESPTVK